MTRKLFPRCGAVFTLSGFVLPLLGFPVVAMPLLDALPRCIRPITRSRRIASYCLSSHCTKRDCVCALTNRIAGIVRSTNHVILILHTRLANPFICNASRFVSHWVWCYLGLQRPSFPRTCPPFRPQIFRKRGVFIFVEMAGSLTI